MDGEVLGQGSGRRPRESEHAAPISGFPAPTLRVPKCLIENARSLRRRADIAKATGLPTGTLYPLLARPNGAGWLVDEWENISPVTAKRPKKRLYRLTDEAQLEARRVLNQLRLTER